MVEANTWADLHLVARADLPPPVATQPALVIEPDRFVYADQIVETADDLGLALHNAAARSPVLGLAIDRGASWQRVVQAFERAEREGFEQIELYYAAPASEPTAPTTLDTSRCEILGQALDRKAASAIAPAFVACGCHADT
ncbi:MAG TPA: hypothetical protein VJ696_04815, partial [Rhodanobacteraceae bacterium]|nr:hypothetical protein [Rhodanobacteraceae bacterium]